MEQIKSWKYLSISFMIRLPRKKERGISFRYLFFLFLIVLYVFVSLFVTARDVAYRMLTPLVETNEDNLVLFDYYVYGTEERFNEAMGKVVLPVKDELKKKGEAVVVKIPGKGERIFYSDYSVVFDESVPELNIEIHIVKNISLKKISVPFATAERLFEVYLARIAKAVYVFILVLTLFLCFEKIIKRYYKKDDFQKKEAS